MPITAPTSRQPSSSLRVRLEDFRLFSDSGWFRIAPLTCLVGRNSSGKSSVLAALLLLKQSIEQEPLGSTAMSLSLTGPYCDLGTFSDLVHNHRATEFSISVALPLRDLAEMGHPQTRVAPLVRSVIPRSLPRFPGFFGRWSDAKLPLQGSIEARMSFSADEPFGPSLSRLEISIDGIGSAHFVRTISGERRQHWRVYTATLPPRTVQLRVPFRGFFPIIQLRHKAFNRLDSHAKHRIKVFLAGIERLFAYVQRTLARSEVIGPFRTPPERRYGFGGFSTPRSGPNGAQSINVLVTELLFSKTRTPPLHKAVSRWIRHLGLAQSLRVKDVARKLHLFEVGFTGVGQSALANFADVGFGISQTLPVIVQGLLMQPGGIYLVQQPELHLHPDAQAGLADFFLFLASQGVVTVVETHSEYLLLRIRLRLAEAARRRRPVKTRGALQPTDIAVLYSGPREKGARVTELEIGEGFQFENLPEGFMSQALEDRVALLSALKR